jgi:hypothetical protein
MKGLLSANTPKHSAARSIEARANALMDLDGSRARPSEGVEEVLVDAVKH